MSVDNNNGGQNASLLVEHIYLYVFLCAYEMEVREFWIENIWFMIQFYYVIIRNVYLTLIRDILWIIQLIVYLNFVIKIMNFTR